MNSSNLDGKVVYVLDAYGMIYQVFHSIREMSSPQGEPTGATFGFVRDVLTVLNDGRPDYLFCAFDLPIPTFRHSFFPEYKANRSETPDDLKPQIRFVREFLNAAGIAILEKPGFEADDIMATVATQTARLDGKCVLVTSDKDARQLISERISLFNLRKQAFYTEKELWDDWGIRPDQVVDFQTMVGDATDNIPGIPKIGVKTATKLLQEYGTLENVFQNVQNLKGTQKTNFENSRAITEISRRLVRLETDVPLEIHWDEKRFPGIDPDYLTRLFKYFGFRSLIPKIDELAEKLGTRPATVWDSDGVLAPKIRPQSVPGDPLSDPDNDSSPALGTSVQAPALSTSRENSKTAPSLFDLLDQSKKTASDSVSSLNFSNVVSDSPSRSSEAIVSDGDLDNSTSLEIRLTRNPYSSEQTTVSPNVPATDRVPNSAIQSETNSAWSILPERRIETFDAPNPQVGTPCYRLIDSPEAFDDFLQIFSRQTFFSLDLETTDIRPRFAKIVGISVCFDSRTAYYLPIRGPLGSRTLDEKETLDALRPILESPTILKIGQNIKYDWIVLKNVGVSLRGVVFDTMIADYLLHAGSRNHNLDDMAENYLNHQTIKISELIGTGKNQRKMNEISPEIVADYAGEDALIPWLLYPILVADLKKCPGLLRLLTDLEIPLVETLVEMEFAGISIDSNHFKTIAKDFSNRLVELERQIRDLAENADPDPVFAENFNINSPKQLQRLLFDDLKLPIVKKTKTGPSADVEVLEELATIHPLPAKLIEHRRLTKLVGTYVNPLPTQIHPETGRIHASFNQVVTATGRLSSSDPNLQNIPIRNDEGKKIRQGFIPDASKGFDCLLSCDYSQIELRVLSHFSGDANLQAAFQNDFDVHRHVASAIFDVPPELVSSEMRRKAKAVNFGLIYGQSSFGLSKSINVSRSEAQAYIDSFFATYPGILDFLDRVLVDCQKKGFVQTLLGRRRRIEGVRGARGTQQLNMPERTAINTVIQGSAADLMKLAMLNVYRRLYRPKSQTTDEAISENLRSVGSTPPAPANAQLLLQIHDELLFETKNDFVDELTKIVVSEMELGQPLSVPLKIDAEVSTRWGDD